MPSTSPIRTSLSLLLSLVATGTACGSRSDGNAISDAGADVAGDGRADHAPGGSDSPITTDAVGGVDLPLGGGDVGSDGGPTAAGCAVMCSDNYVVRGDGVIAFGVDQVVRNVDGSLFLAPGALDFAAGRSTYYKDQSACIAKADGTVWCWGANHFGALGAGVRQAASPDPRQVIGLDGKPLTGVRRVAGHPEGLSYCALVEDGRVFCWGKGAQLGHPKVEAGYHSLVARPVLQDYEGAPLVGATDLAVGGSGGCVVVNGVLHCWKSGFIIGLPKTVPILDKAEAVACSLGTCCAIGMPAGHLWCWGGTVVDPKKMTFSDGLPVTDAISVKTGPRGILALRKDGAVIAVPAASSGAELATLGAAPIRSPELFGRQCLIVNGKLYGESDSDRVPFCGAVAPQVTPAICGSRDQPCCANQVCGNGLGCFEGRCACGKPGTPCCASPGAACGDGLQCGPTTGRCGCVSACGGPIRLRHDGSITWHPNSFLRGADGAIFKAPGARDLAGAQTTTSAVTGCVVRSDGSVWCWGRNDHGQLGAGIALPASATPLQVVTAAAALPPIKKIATSPGGEVFCAVAEVGSVWCWGASGSGQLGGGVTQSSNVAVPLLAGAPGSPPVTGVKDVAFLPTFVVMLKNDGTLWSWGGAGFVPPTLSPLPEAATDLACANDGCCVILASKTVHCDGRQVKYRNGAPVTGADAIFATAANVVIRKGDGNLLVVAFNIEPFARTDDTVFVAPETVGELCMITGENEHFSPGQPATPFCTPSPE